MAVRLAVGWLGRRGFCPRVRDTVLRPALAILCSPRKIVGRENLPVDEPFLLVANHSSHADTPILLDALPKPIRRRTRVAAAEDYFFRGTWRARLTRIVMGGFPFPRRGSHGLEAAADLLDRGCCVIMFPEGTRSKDGSIGEFRCGIGKMALAGYTVVPVGIAGAREILPKGTRRPRRAQVVVAIGEPESPRGSNPSAIADALRDRVVRQKAIATWHCEQPRDRIYLFDRLRSFAGSRRAVALVFVWGVAEALAWPLIPDLAVAPMAFLAPRRALVLAAAATTGSVTGGAVAFHVGDAWGTGWLPLVTQPMIDRSAAWMEDEGASGLWHQPLSGIPYKVFAYQAEGLGVALPGFVTSSGLARGARLAAVGLLAGVAGAGLAARVRRIFGLLMLLYVLGFAVGLDRAVAAWR